MPLRRREEGRGSALPLDVLLYVLFYESSMFPQLSTRMKVVKRHSPLHLHDYNVIHLMTERIHTQTSPTSASNARTLVGVRAQRTRLADTSYSLRRVLWKGGSISLKEGNQSNWSLLHQIDWTGLLTIEKRPYSPSPEPLEWTDRKASQQARDRFQMQELRPIKARDSRFALPSDKKEDRSTLTDELTRPGASLYKGRESTALIETEAPMLHSKQASKEWAALNR